MSSTTQKKQNNSVGRDLLNAELQIARATTKYNKIYLSNWLVIRKHMETLDEDERNGFLENMPESSKRHAFRDLPCKWIMVYLQSLDQKEQEAEYVKFDRDLKKKLITTYEDETEPVPSFFMKLLSIEEEDEDGSSKEDEDGSSEKDEDGTSEEDEDGISEEDEYGTSEEDEDGSSEEEDEINVPPYAAKNPVSRVRLMKA
jgi:hypothetical protein